MSGIKILIVDESVLFRGMCSREIVNEAKSGCNVDKVGDAHEALRHINISEPDAILVNTKLTGMTGIDFIREVKGKYSSKIMAISTMESDRAAAMGVGADEFIVKPMGVAASRGSFLQMLDRKIVQLATGVQPFARPPARGGAWCKIVAIGSSTGGTEALSEVLSHLRAPMPPILVVQHISAKFSKVFAARLNRECSFPVKEAEDGEMAKNNTIYVAPGDKHMSVAGSADSIRISCKAGPRIHGVTTSADVLFESVAKLIGNRAVGVILTGMGMDGAAKLLEMRQAGARTLGQDEQSCVVYGMPKAAFNMGAVEKQVSLKNMANEITALVRNG